MQILRNLTEDHGGVEGEKKSYREGGRQTIRLLNAKNKLRVDGGGREGKVGDGHLGSFHNLAIVESAAINVGVQVPLCITTPGSLG